MGIVAELEVVATDDGANPADPAVDNVVVQRPVAAPKTAAQHVVDGLVTEAHHHIDFGVQRDEALAALLEVLDGVGEDRLGAVDGVVIVKLQMHRTGHLGPVVGGDDVGVEVLGHLGHRLHDTLDVHHHRLNSAGGQHHLLLDETGRHRDAPAHENLVAGTADSGQVDALGALFLGQFQHIRLLGGDTEGLGQQRLVAMNGDVDLVHLQDPEIDGGPARHRGAEHDIGQFSGKHRGAPAVGKRGARGLEHDVLVFLVNPHVGAVHHLHHLTVNAAGGDAQFLPDGLAFLRGAFEHRQPAVVLLAEFGQGLLAHFQGDLVDLAALGDHIEELGQRQEFLDVLDLIGTIALGGFDETLDHLPGMIGVGGRAGGHGAGEATGGHGIGGGAADADHLIDAVDELARPHIAMSAASAAGAEQAGGHATGLDPVEGGLDVLGDTLGQNLLG